MTCQISPNSLFSKTERAKKCANTLAHGMGWFFKGLPSGKRVVPIYPMETPNGAANTVGGRFIPSGLLLAQDFTHKPACQAPKADRTFHFWKSFENCRAPLVFSISTQSGCDVTIRKVIQITASPGSFSLTSPRLGTPVIRRWRCAR